MADRQKEEKRKRNAEYAKRFKKKKKKKAAEPRPAFVTFAPSAGPFLAVCARCGKEAELPFRPTGSKPVYCDSCYTRIRSGAITPDPVAAGPATVLTVTTAQEISEVRDGAEASGATRVDEVSRVEISALSASE